LKKIWFGEGKTTSNTACEKNFIGYLHGANILRIKQMFYPQRYRIGFSVLHQPFNGELSSEPRINDRKHESIILCTSCFDLKERKGKVHLHHYSPYR
jgi:hypothetical protein